MSEKFDKAALFEWLQTRAGKLQRGREKGVRKGQVISDTIQAKIDANPKARAARDFIIDKGEKFCDVRIGHTRIGDLPHAAQKLTERQLFKLLDKMRTIDPGFNWEAYLPNPADMPIFEAFNCLGVPYGAPWDDVKKAYRKLMRQWHPDKHGESPEAEQRATQKTQEITAAYELIAQHYGK